MVHEDAVIDEECIIFQNVTIGSKWPDGECEGGAPKIGRHVFIGAGAIILGNINIGDNVIIGANAVVITSIPSNSIAVGVPVKIMEKRRKDEYFGGQT